MPKKITNKNKQPKKTEKKEVVEKQVKKIRAKKPKAEKPKVSLDVSVDQETKSLEDQDDKSLKIHPPTENRPNPQVARAVIEGETVETNLRQPLNNLKKEPQTMEELLSKTGYQLQGIKKSQEVAAMITDITKRTVFFDVGGKTEGILIEKEMEQVEDFVSYLKPGDTVTTLVLSPENEKGQILLSLRKSANNWRWRLFERFLKSGEALDVRGLDINRGGMIARVLNIRGFIPISQFSRQWAGKLHQLYNKVFSVKVIEVDKDKNRLIFSERAVSESEMLQKQQQLLTHIKIGQTYKAEVSGIMPFGIFVRVLIDDKQKQSFLDGLVHISEISWEKVNDIAKFYKVGDLVDVQLLDIDRETGKLNLSIKRLLPDPWEELAKKYKPDTKVTGKVTRVEAYGTFIEIEKGIEGLIHISKIPTDTSLAIKQKVKVYIESIDPQNHRISLGMILSTKPVGYK